MFYATLFHLSLGQRFKCKNATINANFRQLARRFSVPREKRGSQSQATRRPFVTIRRLIFNKVRSDVMFKISVNQRASPRSREMGLVHPTPPPLWEMVDALSNYRPPPLAFAVNLFSMMFEREGAGSWYGGGCNLTPKRLLQISPTLSGGILQKTLPVAAKTMVSRTRYNKYINPQWISKPTWASNKLQCNCCAQACD